MIVIPGWVVLVFFVLIILLITVLCIGIIKHKINILKILMVLGIIIGSIIVIGLLVGAIMLLIFFGLAFKGMA